MAEPAVIYEETPLPEPAVRGKQGLYSATALGLDPATCGPAFSAREHFQSERYAALAMKERYFRGEQHDSKLFDFQQRLMPSPSGVQPLMGGVLSASYVPLDQRRPCAPYRLTRKVVRGFTTLVFGRGSFPAIRVVGDPDTQLFAEALVKAAKLPSVMVRARTLGGAVGTVGLSWRFWQGSPRVQVHNARSLIVHAWADRELLVPQHVTELTQYEVVEVSGKERVKRPYWRRRDWTEQADIAFVDVPADVGDEPEWVIDEAETVVHGDGFAHFVWCQNLPDLDGTNEDGECDLESLHDNLDMVDLLASVTASGGAKNLDPTLVLDVDQSEMGNGGVSKGSDNAIAFKGASSSKYLELSGASVAAGKDLIAQEVQRVHDVAGFVQPDPDRIAAAGTSGAAISLLYGPMLMQGQVLREQYGPAIEHTLEQMIASARRRMPETDPTTGEASYPVEVGQDGAEQEVDFFLALPPRVIEEPVVDPTTGQPTGKVLVRQEELRPGKGGDVELEWGPFFETSETDKQAKATTLTTANGGRAVLSHQTSVEQYARANGLDPAAEWKRVQDQLDAEKQAQATMFPDAGNPDVSQPTTEGEPQTPEIQGGGG